MRYHRGHRWSCGRVELFEGRRGAVDVEWDLEGLVLPRVKLWPDERGMLVGLSLGDAHSDPVLGADVRVGGFVGHVWSEFLWRWRRG